MAQFWDAVIAKPRTVLAVTAGVVTFGAVAAVQLPVDYLPRIEIPVVQVLTQYPSIGAEEIEQLITQPVERAVASVSGAGRIESLSTHGVSLVSLRVAWGADMARVVVEVREQIDGIAATLPRASERPLIMRTDLSMTPVAVLAVFPGPTRRREDQALLAIGRVVEHDLASEIRRVPSIGRVEVIGALEPELKVAVDPEAASAAGLSLPQIGESIAEQVVNRPLGVLRSGDNEYPLRLDSGVSSLEDLARLRVDGVRLSRIANLSITAAEPDLLFHAAAHGRDEGVEAGNTAGARDAADAAAVAGAVAAVGIAVYPHPNAGMLGASRALRRALPELSDAFADEVKLTLVEDAAAPISAALRDLAVALAVGILAALAVVYYARRNPLSAAACAAVIPVTLAGSAAILLPAGITVNLVSLAGVAIGLGMVLDNAIVVSDRLEYLTRRNPAVEVDPWVRAVGIGGELSECARATFGGTATTALVFLPIAFVPGPVGAVFRELAITVSVLLAVSYCVSLTFLPALLLSFPTAVARTHRGVQTQPARSAGTAPLQPHRITRLYHRALGGTLSFARSAPARFVVPAALALMAVITVALFYTRPSTLFNRDHEEEYRVRLEFPAEFTVDRVRAETGSAVRMLGGVEGVTVRYAVTDTRLGRSALGGLPSVAGSSRYVTVALTVTPPAAHGVQHRTRGSRTDRVTKALSVGLGTLPVVSHHVSPIDNPVETLLGGGEHNTLILRAETRAALAGGLQRFTGSKHETGANEMAAAARTEPSYRLIPDFDRLARAGASPTDLFHSLRHAVEGGVPTHLPEGDYDLPIRVTVPTPLRSPSTVFETLRIPTNSGRFVPANAVARLETERMPKALHRIDRLPAEQLTISGSVDGRAIDHRLDAEIGVTVEHAEQGALRAARTEMTTVFAAAFLVLLILLVALLDSLRLPIMVLSVVPCYLAGGLLALALTSTPLSIGSALGLLVLLGTAVNASILLTVGYSRKRSYRRSIRDLVTTESARRFEPAVTSALTTVVALVPLVLGPFSSNILIRDTTVPLLGGLIVGTAATLLLYPALYLQCTRVPAARPRPAGALAATRLDAPFSPSPRITVPRRSRR